MDGDGGGDGLPVVDVAVALGDLCYLIHEMAACEVLVVVRDGDRDGYGYQRGGSS